MKVKKSSSSFQRQYGQLDDDDDDEGGDSVSIFSTEVPIAKGSGSGGNICNNADRTLVQTTSSSSPSSSSVPTGNDNRTQIKSKSRSPSGHKKSNNLTNTTSKSDRSKSPSTSRRFRRKKKEFVREDGCGSCVGVVDAPVTAAYAAAAEAVTFAQLDLSKGVHEDEIVIGWVRNVGRGNNVALNGGSHRNDAVSNPPPRRRCPKDSKSTSSTTTASPGSRRRQERTGNTPLGENCRHARKQAVEKGDADIGFDDVAVAKRSSSREKKQRRRKLKAECLNVSSEMEIGWHRNTGALTEREQTPTVIEKPASLSSVKAQYIPAHLRVYAAKTALSSPSPKHQEGKPTKSSIAGSFSPGGVQKLPVPTPLNNENTVSVSLADRVPEVSPSHDIADGATNAGQVTIGNQKGSQEETEVRPRGRRMPRRSSSGIGPGASPSRRSESVEISMTWRRERVAARASSRDRKARVSSDQGGDNLTSELSVTGGGASKRSEANKLAYATLRRARARSRSSDKDGEEGIGRGKLEKPPRNRSFDYSGRREKPKRNASLGSGLPPRQSTNFDGDSSRRRIARTTSEPAEQQTAAA